MGPRSLVALSICICAAPLAGQRANLPDLPTVMRGSETVGREPSAVRWSPDGEWIYFSWLPPGTDWRESTKPYRVRARAGATPEEVSREFADSIAPALANGITTRNGKFRYTSSGGDLWQVSLPQGSLRRLTRTNAGEQVSALSTDESRLFFQSGGNLHALTIATGYVEQLTDIRTGTAPDTTRRLTPQRKALERDQLDLFKALRDDARADSIRRLESAQRDSLALPITWLGRDWRLRSLEVSPTGNHAIIVATQSPSPEPRRANVPNYVTHSGYTEEIPTYAKVGDADSRTRVGVLTIANGKVNWIRPFANDSSDRYGSLSVVGWNDAGTAALVRADNSDYDRRILVRVDTDASITIIDELTDTAWVGGPCGGCVGWLPGEQGIWFASEATGYAHLYRTDPRGQDRITLTSGKWEVLRASLSPARDHFQLHTNETTPFEQHYWTMALDGSRRTQVTTARGGHNVVVSPDGRWLADVYSKANRPGELFLQPSRAGVAASQLTTSPTAEWLKYDWIEPEIVMIPASDGVEVPARIYRPEQFGAQSNGAAVLFVHGAGYLHNVHNYWSSYYREYQFHHLLAARGYVVLDVDYRGSAGYGRDWRTAIYRHMGGRDLEDFVDASKWITTTMGIPGDRIGIYGGSYGGFITLMALFTRPQYFGAGAALRAVTDWAHYNHGYTARILNEPQSDTLAYRRSSPIFFAEGLEDPLLIAHGMIDTNVHFQDVVRLSQRLIELGKDRWELAVYPLENHGFERPDSWTDEYRRILDLFDRWLPEVRGTRE
jgi:dipeptidyl aminopeptidase/acylaminoacyl peptidase